MNYRLSLLMGLAAIPGIASAATDDQQVQLGPMPGWAATSEPMAIPAAPSGLAFVRDQDLIIHLDAKGKSIFIAQRVALLQSQALQLGNIAISWNPANGKPTVHTLRIHRGSESIDVLERTRFEVLRREDQLEQAMLSGILTAVLKVPDLRVGDELEVAYTVPSVDPTFGGQSADMLFLKGPAFPGRYRLRVSWDAGAEPIIRATDDFGVPVTRSGNALEIRADNPPLLNPPKDAPPRYAWQRVIEFSDFRSWGTLSQRFAGLFTEAAKLSPNSPLDAEIARIAREELDALGRMQAALALVQQQVRYVYVGLDGGNFRPAKADATWERRYGDCKAKTALLLALLDKLGIVAEAVLVRNDGSDDGFDARLPNPGLFDHVLVRATIGEKRYWLDGTLPVVATASEAPDFLYHWILPVSSKSTQALEHLAWTPAAVPDSINLYEIDARSGLDTAAKITSTSIKRGPEALLEYLQYSAISADQLLEALRSSLTGDSTWNSIESARYRFDPKARAGVLEIIGTGPLDWEKDGAEGRSLTLPGGGFSPPNRRLRASGRDSNAPFYNRPEFDCFVTTVRLPEATKPDHWGYNSVLDTSIFGRIYYRAFEKRDATIRMIRGSRVEKTEIDLQQAERDNARLPRFDNSKAWIFYSPGVNAQLPAAQARVPASYEADWLNDARACLPLDMRR